MSKPYINLANTLSYFHYGNPWITVGRYGASEFGAHDKYFDDTYYPDLDMRASVGHLTRKIKIFSDEE